MKTSKIICALSFVLFAAPALASTAGEASTANKASSEAADHHGRKHKPRRVIKRRVIKQQGPHTVAVKKVHPRRRRRIVRRRAVRVPPRRRVIRRTRVVHAPPRVATTTHYAPAPQSDAVRADKPLSLTFAQKGILMSGVELGINVGPHLQFTGALGVSSTEFEVDGCRGPGCDTAVQGMWSAGVKALPLRSAFSPYVHLGVMGSLADVDRTVGLIGAGVNYTSRFGLTAGVGLDYAMGEESVDTALVPSLNVGFAF
ncbi:MAG: opacity protein-like surface antigen [Myxococcota bacterium]|jgi:opacity protein-like surface antigen